MADSIEGIEIKLIRDENKTVTGIVLDGKVFSLAERKDDTDKPSYVIGGSRYIKVPRALEVRTVKKGERVQVSAPEFRGLGNFMCYVAPLVDSFKVQSGFHYVNFVLDTDEYRKQRASR